MNSENQLQDQKKKQITPQMLTNIVQQTQKLYQDLSYITGIAIEVQATLDHFKADPNHPMVNIQLNRMITQANLSNGIAVAMTQEGKTDGILDQLVSEKHQVKNYFEELIKNNKFDERINTLLSEYKKNNLTDNPVIFQQKFLPMVQKCVGLNQETLQKLINAIGQQDQIADQIQRDPNSYSKPTLEEIKQINIQRQQNAYQKLFINFTIEKFNNWLINQYSKCPDIKESIKIFNQYLNKLDSHLQDFENKEKYNKIYTELNFKDDLQKQQFRSILKFLISSDLGTIDTYFCQTDIYLTEKQIPERITRNKLDIR